MKPLAFFRMPEVARILARAARCAGTPLSVHPFERGREGLRMLGYGHCAMCRHIARWDGGKAACLQSREPVSKEALRRARPLPFFCSMGFACLAVPLPDIAPNLVLTFGPYCPSEASASLENDAAAGLEALGAPLDDAFRDALSSIPIVPAATVPGIAEWTVEALGTLWTRSCAEAHEPVVEAAPQPQKRRKKAHPPVADPYDASTIAALLLGGEQGEARQHFRGVLAESVSGERVKIAVKRARAVAAAAAVLEAAERNHVDTTACWARLPELVAQVAAVRAEEGLVEAGMQLLGILKRKAVRAAEPELGNVELNEILTKHLLDGITLEEVARQLGQNPTAITHRLQRHFNMSFSHYKGRLQIDKAKELLRRTALSVTAVGRRVGINDTSNFCKQFVKFEAMTPLEYRERFGRKR